MPAKRKSYLGIREHCEEIRFYSDAVEAVGGKGWLLVHLAKQANVADTGEKLLTIADVALLLKEKRRTVEGWCESRKLGHFRLNQIYVRPVALSLFLDDQLSDSQLVARARFCRLVSEWAEQLRKSDPLGWLLRGDARNEPTKALIKALEKHGIETNEKFRRKGGGEFARLRSGKETPGAMAERIDKIRRVCGRKVT